MTSFGFWGKKGFIKEKTILMKDRKLTFEKDISCEFVGNEILKRKIKPEIIRINGLLLVGRNKESEQKIGESLKSVFGNNNIHFLQSLKILKIFYKYRLDRIYSNDCFFFFLFARPWARTF